MADVVPAPPHGRYKRALEGADFSLEALTESVPADGRFYLLRGGKQVLATEDFQEALSEYNKLCKALWLGRLEHENIPIRVQAAWGLLGLDPSDKEAQAIIIRDGTPQERKRLEQAQSRRRALRSRQAAANAKAAASANAAAAKAAAAVADAAEAAAAKAAAAAAEVGEAAAAAPAAP
jgi:nucleoid-associated protein YgaU